VASEDKRILDHAKEHGAEALLTSEHCKTGTDRALETARQIDPQPEFVFSLQGDNPLIPVNVIANMLAHARKEPETEVITPVHRLSWEDLDRLRRDKELTPHSGTTVTLNPYSQALWFSKAILPVIRKEDELRWTEPLSPVWRHIGFYGYRMDILERFTKLEEGYYEKLEGLEQLRLLENGISIQCIPVDIPEGAMLSGIDSPEDLARAEELFKGV
jgi:3-deoxy-manno-octulosonate cytidylyltransferase (CMP-KDO synthetase)